MPKLQNSLASDRIAQLVEETVLSLACDLRPDYRQALELARQREDTQRGRKVLEQLSENARIATAERVPLCQDTGYVWVLLEVAGDCAVPANIFSGVDAAVARAYKRAGLRKSILADALLERTNTGNNTPAFCELHLITQPEVCEPSDSVSPPAAKPSATATLHVMLKGGGSDNASRLVMLPPGAGKGGVCNAVLAAVREKAASACPPIIVGVGVGATFDKVAGLAKRALLREIGTPNPVRQLQDLEQDWLARINALGIGPGGFGGDVTALAVHILTAPCHIAALPVAINIGCSAMRSASINLARCR